MIRFRKFEGRDVRYARRFLKQGDYRSALAALGVYDFIPPDKIPNAVPYLQQRAWQMGIEGEVEKAQRALENGDHQWAVSAVINVQGYSEKAKIKVTKHFSELERRAYQMAVNMEFEAAKNTVAFRDFNTTDYHRLMMEMYASKFEGLKVPEEVRSLKRNIDLYLRPETFASEEERQRYDREFNMWYNVALYMPEEGFIRKVKALSHNLIFWVGSTLDDNDATRIVQNSLETMKSETRVRYFRMLVQDFSHDEAIETSLKPLHKLIGAVRAGRLTHSLSSIIRESSQLTACCYSHNMYGI